jgi:hypothetical protein
MNPIRAEELLPWVRSMVRMRGRQRPISHLTGVTSTVVKQIWQKENQRSSPSGQTPSDIEWYIRTPTLRFQSAMLLNFYHLAESQFPKEIAFAYAYFHFASLTGGEWQGDHGAYRSSDEDYTITFSRALFLTQHYTDAVYFKSRRRLFPLAIKTCRCCKSNYLAREEEQSKCPMCD